MASEPQYSSTDIAVVGLAGRFPRARNLDEFWERIRDGVECISRLTPEELRESGLPEVALTNPNYVNAVAWLEEADMFDAGYFGFTPREAEAMDPQHRVFLECAVTALEDAGYGAGYDGPVGVFAGASMNSYLTSNLMRNPEVLEAAGPYQLMIGNDKDFVATRVAYKLNLSGPAMSIQTACSTSLVAIQVACQSLLTFQSDMALAGGVAVYWPQKQGYLYQEGMILSPDGHCRAFDAEAKGTVGGQGVGVVVLKRLEDAMRDGDTINAIVKGTAINNDGSNKVGFTAPSVDGQAEVIAMAQAMADVDPASISLIEAHGTGTPLGDPIELAALTQVFRASTNAKQFCAIGSVKTNIGHLDAAAGVAGFIKAVLSLKHGIKPPSLHFEQPNPQLDLENSPFTVQTSASEWNTDGQPRRAGVSSFGIGGTNAHAVLEEAPAREAACPARPWQLLVWSAKTAQALQLASDNLASYLQTHPDASLANVAHTLQSGRKRFPFRRALVARDVAHALELLEAEKSATTKIEAQDTVDRPVVFMFSGQGSQYANMAASLYQNEPSFRQCLDQCAALLETQLGCDLRDKIFSGDDEGNNNELNQTGLAQPALFAIEYSLAQLWIEWGIEPDGMIGHSIGEYVAACLAGVMSLEDALSLVAARGQLMQGLPSGDMLAVFAASEAISNYLDGDVSLAAINGPEFCTVSGASEQVAALMQRLDADDVEYRELETSHAFHSAMMDPILDEFTSRVATIDLHAPTTSYVSNVTGNWITSEQATDPAYWAQHLRGTVKFEAGLSTLLAEPNRVLLEVGPGKTLATFARQVAAGNRGIDINTSLPHPNDPSDDSQFVLQSAAILWQCGVRFDWKGFNRHGKLYRIPLPTYPFERSRYLAEPKPLSEMGMVAPDAIKIHDKVEDWFYIPSWRRSLPDGFAQDDSVLRENANWIIFCDRESVGERFAQRLARHDRKAILVRAGEKYDVNDAGITLDAIDKTHYEKLVDSIEHLESRPCRILHLWNLGESDSSLQRSLDEGFYSLLYLAQALGDRPPPAVKLLIAASGMHGVRASDKRQPEKSLLVGPAKVIPQEYPYVSGRSVDFAVADILADPEKAVDRLVAELKLPGNSAVAYRGAYRWLESYEPVRIGPTNEQQIPLRLGGTYLITGGLGGIGLALSQYLARDFQAKLILTGRSKLPDRSDWENYIASNDKNDPVVQCLLQIRELEELGAEVMLIQADVADSDAMRAGIASARDRYGAINGVVHAAGVPGTGIMQLKTREAADAVLRPKVQGTLVLDSLLDLAELDFMLLCSSINSIYGGVVVIDYAAANAYLDAYAASRRAAYDLPVIAVNWDAWQEVGMAADAVEHLPKNMQAARRQALQQAIPTAGGVDAFSRLLKVAAPQFVVSTHDVRAVMESIDAADAERLATAEAGTREDSVKPVTDPGSAQHARPTLSTELVTPRNKDEEKLAAIWSGLLGIESIGVNDDFFELGGHSLLGTRVLSRIKEEFSLKLPLRVVFEAPTIAMLAERIESLRWALESSDEDGPDDLPDDDVEEIVL